MPRTESASTKVLARLQDDEINAPIPSPHLPTPQSLLLCVKSMTSLTDRICGSSSNIKITQKLLGWGAVKKRMLIYWGRAIRQALSQGFYMCSFTTATTSLHVIHVTKGETLEAQENKWWAACGCTGIQSRHLQKHDPEKATSPDYQWGFCGRKKTWSKNLGNNHRSRWLKWVEDTTFGRDGVKQFRNRDVRWPNCLDVHATKNDNRKMVGTEAVSPLLKYSWVIRRSWEQQEGAWMV